MEITLDQLLASRESRWHRQQEILRNYPEKTLVCLTVIMPGKVKRNFSSLIVAQAALTALINQFLGHSHIILVQDLDTGFEAFLITDYNIAEAKHMTCEIEDSHPLGRLFDIDVIGKDGAPVSRTETGSPARRCLLCNNEARFCMRNHTHSPSELHEKINKMVENYVQRV